MRKGIVSLMTAVMLLSAVPGYAMTAEQIGDKTIRLSGSTEKAGEMVALDVLAGETKPSELEEIKNSGGNLMDVWVTHLQAVTDEKGAYTFAFDIALPSGKYTAYAGVKNQAFEPYSFVFVSESDFRKMAEEINTADVERIAEIINDENLCYVIGLSEDEVKAVEVRKLAEVLQKTLKTAPFDKENREASWLTVDRAYFTEMLNEGKIKNLYQVDEKITDFAHSDISAWYGKENLSAAFKENFTQRMSGRRFEDYEAYRLALPEAFVLAMVKNPSGVSDVEKVMTDFQKEIGITVTGKTPSRIWNKLAGNDYADFSDLKKAFNDYSESGGTSGGSHGGTGGTGGSGGSGGSRGPSGGVSGGSPEAELPVTQDSPQEHVLNPYIFSDIEGVEWARNAIVALAEKGIVSGVGEGKFQPEGLVTREEFVKIVMGAFVPEGNAGTEMPFSDVEPGAWYTEYISEAYAAGIIKGMDDGRFGVGMNITRQDLCVMIYQAAAAAGIKLEPGEESFEDDALISDYAKEAVCALKKAGAVNGINDREFGPLDFATRAQAAKIIYELIR